MLETIPEGSDENGSQHSLVVYDTDDHELVKAGQEALAIVAKITAATRLELKRLRGRTQP